MGATLWPPARAVKLTQEINEHTWLASNSSGERLIARRFREHPVENDSRCRAQVQAYAKESQAREDLFYNPEVLSSVWQILNHENIVSLWGFVRRPPPEMQFNRSQDELWAIWDFCDAGNLEHLFANVPPQNPQPRFYLPESLCWHVLRSLLRAVVFLHDGQRRRFDEHGKLREWVSLDKDWSPILHRSILPQNIFLQHPRGKETYGPCKLGSFDEAALTNHVLNLTQDPAARGISIAVTSKVGWQPLRDVLGKPAQDAVRLFVRPYSLAGEIASIAAVVFEMMTGQHLHHTCSMIGCHLSQCQQDGGCLQRAVDENDECECINGGCRHVPENDCTHPVSPVPLCNDELCGYDFINIDTDLARVNYSWWLRNQVRLMLDLRSLLGIDHGTLTSAVGLADQVEYAFKRWREATAEGRAYRDVDDELEESWAARDKAQI